MLKREWGRIYFFTIYQLDIPCFRKAFLGVEEATFEDLAFGFQAWREVNGVDLRVCLSGASYAAAEKAERRMALKI